MTNSLQQETVQKLRKNNYRLTLYLAIAISLLLIAISLALPDQGLYSLLNTGLKDIGMSIFIASTVTTGFSEYYRSNREDQSAKELKIYANHVEELFKKQKEALELPIYKNLAEAGIFEFYPSRKGKATDDLRIKLRSIDNGTIRLMGATLRVFFHPGSDFTSTIDYIIRNKPQVKLEVLLLNPNSPEALRRSEAETGIEFNSEAMYHQKSMQYNDLVTTTNQIAFFNSLVTGHQPIEVRFYDAPYCFLVIFEDQCFVSQYIYGDVPTQIHTLELPLIGYKEGSTSFNRLKWHFNHVFIKQSISEQEMLKVKIRFPTTSTKANDKNN